MVRGGAYGCCVTDIDLAALCWVDPISDNTLRVGGLQAHNGFHGDTHGISHTLPGLGCWRHEELDQEEPARPNPGHRALGAGVAVADGGHFTLTTRTEINLTRNIIDNAKAEALADAGV